jgi:hypothetical protein
LPDGIFSNQRSRFGYILKGIAIKDVPRYFLCPFGHFSAIGYILWSFDIFYCHLVYFPPFWYVAPKNLATLDTNEEGKLPNKSLSKGSFLTNTPGRDVREYVQY